MTWHACRLGDVLTLKRGHDLPDSRRQDGDVPVVSSPLKKKGFSNSYFLTMPQPGYNTAPTRPDATRYGPAAYPAARPGRSRC
ncbi:MAG: hypothetical protein USCGTAYLOR_01914 [Chromatiales bacterium USCg_Taylor]|nr:MAG: hypothetical protein USCGTAYLOR_01914 [Chromatiales bacterium USCg_Taylor]